MSQSMVFNPLDRVRAEARRAMEAWFARLDQAEQKQEPVANVFVMGNCLELLKAFDIHMVFPEILALQTAVRKVSLDYINTAEGWGMSTDACNYVKADLGMALKGMRHPSGRIPKPTLAIGSNICLVFTKWAEIWERLHQCPAYILDIPMGRAHGRPYLVDSAEYMADKEYVLAQLWELVELLEKLTEKKLDLDKLADAEAQTNRAMRAWRGILEINQSIPALYDSLADGIVFLGMINIARGSAEGAQFFEMALEEFRRAAAQRIGAIPEEKFRLLFHGVACYPALRRFQAMFHGWNSVFVTSPYLTFACGGFTGDLFFDTSRPMESLADLTLRCNHVAHQAMYYTDEFLLQRALIENFNIDGIVFHAVKSCRTVSTSHANTREFLAHQHKLPCLYLESDHVDPRYFSEAQIKNRVDAFFEALTQKKYYAKS